MGVVPYSRPTWIQFISKTPMATLTREELYAQIWKTPMFHRSDTACPTSASPRSASTTTSRGLASDTGRRRRLGRHDLLPDLPACPRGDAQLLQATGTDDKKLAPQLAPTTAFSSRFVSSPVSEEGLPTRISERRNPHNRKAVYAKPAAYEGFENGEGDGTRTRNHRIDSPASPGGNHSGSKDLREADDPACTPACTPYVEEASPDQPRADQDLDSDLANITVAWLDLPENIRLAILNLIEPHIR